MKAMRAHQAGGPEQLRYEDAPEPSPGDGQVLVRVRAAGINPADLVRLSGKLAPLHISVYHRHRRVRRGRSAGFGRDRRHAR